MSKLVKTSTMKNLRLAIFVYKCSHFNSMIKDVIQFARLYNFQTFPKQHFLLPLKKKPKHFITPIKVV